MNAVVLIGIPGSGKSTFFTEKFATSHVRINRDTLRTKHRVQQLQRCCVELGIAFVSDNTNVTVAERAELIEAARAADFSVHGYYFEGKIDACLERNERRPKEQVVPVAGVRARRNELQFPSLDEGFDELYFVRVNESGGWHVSLFNDDGGSDD